jgi:hypothetical protein
MEIGSVHYKDTGTNYGVMTGNVISSKEHGNNITGATVSSTPLNIIQMFAHSDIRADELRCRHTSFCLH